MKVISIMQPWATLIALGEKVFETRSWKTNYRGEIAIHASKKIDRAACKTSPIVETLNKHEIVLLSDLPTGEILAIAELEECHKVIRDNNHSAIVGNRWVVSHNEYQFGDFSAGRFAWELTNVRALENPIPAKGQLGIWNYNKKLEE
ncbi:ASCH domain-containing protein [Virgibacillus doumboii]|uniref:ASCH domain-containing protein n=1 Tax=Virgibacillus doumboii TaxID=2697503 RepID=UPI0013E066AE|nr:ASCH domain-containing protein [Virgibacillus doumboii]